jgi:hypothetical protein
MTKSDQLVVGPLTDQLENGIMTASDKKKFAIKNGHTEAQMRAMERRFAAHKGPFLTLQQALDLAKAHQAQQTVREESADQIVTRTALTSKRRDHSMLREAQVRIQGRQPTQPPPQILV